MHLVPLDPVSLKIAWEATSNPDPMIAKNGTAAQAIRGHSIDRFAMPGRNLTMKSQSCQCRTRKDMLTLA